MALTYKNLDERTRKFMLKEVELDELKNNIYLSPRLNDKGVEKYITLLKEAILKYSDKWLADELRTNNCFKKFEDRRKKSGGFTKAKVPITAADTLTEGEFNRFYVRGLCLRAIEDNILEVIVYRGKTVSQPRPRSVSMIGNKIQARALLNDLRSAQGVEPALGLPPGANSGLTVCLP